MKLSIFLIFLALFGITAAITAPKAFAVTAEDLRGSEAPAATADMGTGEVSQKSIMYELISENIFIMHRFVLKLFDDIASQTRGIFIIGVLTYLFFTIAKWWQTRQIQIANFAAMMAGMMFAYYTVYIPGTFETWIYSPVVKTTMKLTAYILQSSAGGIIGGGDPLQNTLVTMEAQIGRIMNIGNILMSKGQDSGLLNMVEGLQYTLKGFAVNIIYMALMLVFGIMYMLGIIAMHFLLVFAPISILMGSIPSMRWLLVNWLKALFTYALVPVFAGVAMGATLFILQDVSAQAMAWAASSTDDPPPSLYRKVIIVGLFSFYFHLKASEFAAMIIGGTSSNFGSVFAATTSMGLAGGKLLLGRAASPAMNQIGRGTRSLTERIRNR
jgi:hypothetical protein